jgi:WD40 repeat protein
VQPSAPHRIIGRHSGPVDGIALGEIDGRVVVVSGSDDRTIRLWYARNGAPIGQPLAGHTSAVRAVALGAVDGRAVVVSGSWDTTIRLWDAGTGAPIGQPPAGYTSAVSTVARSTA